MATLAQREEDDSVRKVQVSMDKDLYLRLKLAAAERRVSMGQVVAEALAGSLPAAVA